MFLIAMLIYIAVYDFKFHRISNTSLLSLVAVNIITSDRQFNLQYGFICLAVGVLLFARCGVGGGDVKLASLLALLVIPANHFIVYWEWVSFLCLLFIIVRGLLQGNFRGNIPLAPMLCGAVLCLKAISIN